jgi:hypothetical protein
MHHGKCAECDKNTAHSSVNDAIPVNNLPGISALLS